MVFVQMKTVAYESNFQSYLLNPFPAECSYPPLPEDFRFCQKEFYAKGIKHTASTQRLTPHAQNLSAAENVSPIPR